MEEPVNTKCLSGYLLPALLFISSTIYGASSWELFGLKNEYIHSLLLMPASYGEDELMVGTSNAIRQHDWGVWLTPWTGSAVYDLALLPNDDILAIAGNGSDSDGVYRGRITAIGEPGTFWTFEHAGFRPYPTAMTFVETPNSTYLGTVYVGSISGVEFGAISDKTFIAMDSIDTDPRIDPFGPFCSAVHWFSEEERLYAGGYNSYNGWGIVAVPPSYLLSGDYSRLSTVQQLEVTAMQEVHVEGENLLAIATVDSGVVFFSEGSKKFTVPPPQPYEKITALAVLPLQHIFDDLEFTPLVAATPSGIYRQCPPTADCRWNKLGDLPHKATCIDYREDGTLWAGTDSGLYRYRLSTEIVTKEKSVSLNTAGTIRQGRNGTTLLFPDPVNGIFTLTDLSGHVRLRRNLYQCGTITIHQPAGLYLYRLVTGSGTVQQGCIRHF